MTLHIVLALVLLVACSAGCSLAASAQAADDEASMMPRFRRGGDLTQLIVDGKPPQPPRASTPAAGRCRTCSTSGRRVRRCSNDPAMRGGDMSPSGSMVIASGIDEYTILGNGLTVTHAARDHNMRAGLLEVEEWVERDGRWKRHRWLNGDQTDQGRKVFLPADRIGMLRVRLYPFR